MTWLAEQGLVEDEDPTWEWVHRSVNPGCSGACRSTISLLSIDRTVDIFGLFMGNSCTHNNPMCKLLVISVPKSPLDILVSINSAALSSFHSFHAWKTTESELTDVNENESEVKARRGYSLRILKGLKRIRRCRSSCSFYHL